jgi:hypothetical protein
MCVIKENWTILSKIYKNTDFRVKKVRFGAGFGTIILDPETT